jgi:hypothetical protein
MYQIFFIILILSLLYFNSSSGSLSSDSEKKTSIYSGAFTVNKDVDGYGYETSHSCGIDNLGGYDIPTDANAY